LLNEARDVCGTPDDGSIRAEADEALAFALVTFTPFSSPLTVGSRRGDLRLGGGFGSFRCSRALSAAVGGVSGTDHAGDARDLLRAAARPARFRPRLEGFLHGSGLGRAGLAFVVALDVEGSTSGSVSWLRARSVLVISDEDGLTARVGAGHVGPEPFRRERFVSVVLPKSLDSHVRRAVKGVAK